MTDCHLLQRSLRERWRGQKSAEDAVIVLSLLASAIDPAKTSISAAHNEQFRQMNSFINGVAACSPRDPVLAIFRRGGKRVMGTLVFV